MFVFRTEHEREFCKHPFYHSSGESLTGHGPFVNSCDGFRPNFGIMGNSPVTIMPHERCAVTADQFELWVSPSYRICEGMTNLCQNDGYTCYECPPIHKLTLPKQWQVVAYWVNEDMEGTDWRIDNGQVVFNPEFAVPVGPVTVWEVEQLVSVDA